MTEKRTEPAFPVAEDHEVADDYQWTAGITKRDYFAAKAMTALIKKIPLHDTGSKYGKSSSEEGNNAIRMGVARSAYDYADAMLQESEK